MSVSLYLESASDYRITLQRGKTTKTVSVERAAEIWKSGKVDDWNLAFRRLVDCNFDIAAVKAFYAQKRETSAAQDARPTGGPKA